MYIPHHRPELIALPKLFIDTLGILLDRNPSNAFFNEIRPYCGNCSKHNSKDLKLDCRLTINQPRPEAFDILSRLEECREVKINRVDLALDLPVESAFEAVQLFEWLLVRIFKQWPGKHKFRIRYGETVYSGDGSWGISKFGIYCPYRSKVFESPSVHVEWKALGSQPVRRMGIHSVEDLKAFDPLAFMSKKLVLCEVYPERLGEELRRKGLVEPNGRTDLHLGGTYLRGYAYENALVVGGAGEAVPFMHLPLAAVAMRQICRERSKINKKKVMCQIDTAPFLPKSSRLSQEFIFPSGSTPKPNQVRLVEYELLD